jgi:hypothetical protein
MVTSQPGPGNYSTKSNRDMGSGSAQYSFGSKYKSAVKAGPGPGQYAADKSKEFGSSVLNSCRIGNSSRESPFMKKAKLGLPGPG